MVNKPIVFRLLNNISSYIRDLDDNADITISDYSADLKTQRFVERTLHIAIEAMIDVAHHIISDENFREPDSYADAFQVLSEHCVLSKNFLEKAKLIAQFRNKLVHYYEKIDNEQIFDIFQNHRQDFSEFVEEVKCFLNK